MTIAQAELLDVYRSTPVILRALLRGIDEGRVRHKQDADDWAIVEVVAHLGDAEERTLERVRRMAREDRPFLAAYDQAELAKERGYAAMQLREALERFERLRAAQVAELAALDEAGWGRTGQHEETGTISIESLTAHMAAHDSVHLAQIARLLEG